MGCDAPAGFDRECGPGGLEARALPVGLTAEIRASGPSDAPVIEGYGSVADSPTVIDGIYDSWTEEVAPGAWAQSIANGDIRSMYNHEPPVLARTKAGTLHLSEDQQGLRYRIDVNPEDTAAMNVHARVARGDVSGSSVWFRVVRQEWTYPDESNGLDIPRRRILEGQLIETGPVDFPAFEQTTAVARSLRPLDVVLRAAGVTAGFRRAKIASDLAANPDDLEDELRRLFDRDPELRAAICSCTDHLSGRAAAPAPDVDRAAGAAPELALPSTGLALARARLMLKRR